MSRQFYTADETVDIILSAIEGRLDQISEIISDSESSSEEEGNPTSAAQNEDVEDTSFYPQRRSTPNSSRLVAISKVLLIICNAF